MTPKDKYKRAMQAVLQTSGPMTVEELFTRAGRVLGHTQDQIKSSLDYYESSGGSRQTIVRPAPNMPKGIREVSDGKG